MRPAIEIIQDAIQAERERVGPVREIHIAPRLLTRYFAENPLSRADGNVDGTRLFGVICTPMTRAEHAVRVATGPALDIVEAAGRAMHDNPQPTEYRVAHELAFQPRVSPRLEALAEHNRVTVRIQARENDYRWVITFRGPSEMAVQSTSRAFMRELQAQRHAGDDWRQPYGRSPLETVRRDLNIVNHLAGVPGQVNLEPGAINYANLNDRNDPLTRTDTGATIGADQVREDVGGGGIPGGEPGDVTPAEAG